MMACCKVFIFLMFIALYGKTDGGGCESLEGVWYNQLGSEMILNHSKTHTLFGEYRTAVERQPGAAGTSHSVIVGAAPYNKPGAVFGFSILWREGASVVAQTGQCHVCDGEEVLMTTWVLRSKVDTCLDKWRSTRIGQDYFTRTEQRVGPRKANDTHTPDDVSGRKKRSIAEEEEDWVVAMETRRHRRESDDNRSQDLCNLNGNWYNDHGSKISLKNGAPNLVQGTYQTWVERQGGRSRHSDIYGTGNPDDSNTTMAMFVVWNDGASITGWVGQCHICGNDEEILETVWLHRTQVPGCNANWRSTLHGENSFKRKDQSPASSDPGIVGEFGDELVSILCVSAATSAQFTWILISSALMTTLL